MLGYFWSPKKGNAREDKRKVEAHGTGGCEDERMRHRWSPVSVSILAVVLGPLAESPSLLAVLFQCFVYCGLCFVSCVLTVGIDDGRSDQ